MLEEEIGSEETGAAGGGSEETGAAGGGSEETGAAGGGSVLSMPQLATVKERDT